MPRRADRTWPVKVTKKDLDALSQTVKRAKRSGREGDRLRGVIILWEGSKAALRWGICTKCVGLWPVRTTRGVHKCLVCGTRVSVLIGAQREEGLDD